MVEVNDVEHNIDSDERLAGLATAGPPSEAKLALPDVRDRPCADSGIIVRALQARTICWLESVNLYPISVSGNSQERLPHARSDMAFSITNFVMMELGKQL